MAVAVNVFVGLRVGIDVRVGADGFVDVKVSVGVDMFVEMDGSAGMDVVVEIGVRVGPNNCPGPQAENNKLEKRNREIKILFLVFI